MSTTYRSRAPEDAANDIDAFLASQQRKGLLRFITCGSVDDGKSTLIGRLLYDSNGFLEDQMTALCSAPKEAGTQDTKPDFADLVDSLSAEREQGITIDVAYSFFTTGKRKFIVADTPGHEQYTRNMVMGASTADLAIILVDARKGVLTQTRRHSFLASMMGIRNVVLAVNKMDVVGYSEDLFKAVERDYRAFTRDLQFDSVTAIPISGLKGDNIVSASPEMQWYSGPTLLHHLETVDIDQAQLLDAPFRMPVQWVNRPTPDFRGFSGQIASGIVRPGDKVRVLPSGKQTTVNSIVVMEGTLAQAVAGQSVTITLSDEVDCSRGDLLAGAMSPPEAADQFETTLVWMADDQGFAGRAYWMQIGTKRVTATITAIKHKINVNTLEQVFAKELHLNEIGLCHISTDQLVAADPYDVNHDTGGFIFIDKVSNATVAAGTIRSTLRRASNIHWQALEVNRTARAENMGQRAAVLWFTGISGSGKSTIANIVEKKLHAQGRFTALLDGDNVRHGLCRDLSFTEADRVENIRRVAEVAKLMTDTGLIVLTSFISPFRAERRLARALAADGEFVEVFVDTKLDEAEKRDPKGLYKKARRGEIKNFTGIDSPYEPPEAAEIYLDTAKLNAAEAADLVLARLQELGVLPLTD